MRIDRQVVNPVELAGVAARPAERRHPLAGLPQQQWLHLADGRNNQVLTLRRETGEVIDTLGRPGRYAGEFHWVHDLAIDSKGNLYAGEVDTGKRAQKFVRALE